MIMNTTVIISISSLILAIATFIIARHKDTRTDAKDEAYKQGQLDEKLKHIYEKLDSIEKKLDFYDAEIDERIEKAIDEHIKIYHKEEK